MELTAWDKKMENILRECYQNVKIRYSEVPPPRVHPLELRIGNNTHPVGAKPRRYPPGKRRFLQNYVS